MIDGKYIVFYRTRITKFSFICGCYNPEINSTKIIDSKDENFLNDINKIFTFKKFYFCGYGNFHHDDTVMAFILKNMQRWNTLRYDNNKVVNEIYEFSKTVLTKPEDQWKEYKYNKLFPSIDLSVLLMPKKNRVSFEQAECNLMLPIGDIVQDLHNMHKIYTDYAVYQLSIRDSIKEQYGVDVKSLDSVSTGISILRSEYLKATGLSWGSIKDLNTKCSRIIFKDIILPQIKFKNGYLEHNLESIRNLIIPIGEKFNRSILWKHSYINLGMGGLHSIEDPSKIVAAEDESIIYVDINSMFPSIAVKYNIFPYHLRKEFGEIYTKIYNERLMSDGEKRMLLKWVLNSAIGMFRKEGSWLYDPEAFYGITINSQLLLLMLAEKLYENNTIERIVNWNTDGLYLVIKTNKISEMNDVFDAFTQEYGLPMSVDEYDVMWQYNGNNYISYNKDTRHKATGMFSTDIEISKHLYFPIISKALYRYIMLGEDIENTIKSCNDIFMFCTYYKRDKDCNVSYGSDQIDGDVFRYYHSVDGSNLVRFKVDVYTNKILSTVVVSERPCTLCDDNRALPNNIDYQYYIGKCKQIINEIENVQLKLF